MPLRLPAATMLLLALTGVGCRTTNNDGSTAKWGHFKDLDQRIDGAAYLFGIKPSETIHACISGSLPRGLSEDWLKAELFAAVNLWASVIGRALPVVFDGCAAKPALRVAFATPPEGGDFIGYTWFQDGERQIFLSPAYDWEGIDETLGFQRLPDLQSGGWEKKAAFIVPILMSQAYSPLKLTRPGPTGKPRQPSFGTLLHELGHGFGMCDLYTDATVTPDFNGNCSPTNRAASLNADEVMTAGTRPGTARFQLAAEDKTGLRRLAARRDFPGLGWPAATTALTSDAVLARLSSGGGGGSSGSTQPALSITMPTAISYRPGRRTAAAQVIVQGPANASSGLLREKTGRGPLVAFDAEESTVVGDMRQWQLALDLDATAQPYIYIVTLDVAPRSEASITIAVP